MTDTTKLKDHKLTEEEELKELLYQLRLNNSSILNSNQLCEKTKDRLDILEQKVLEYEDNLNKILSDMVSKKSNFFNDVKRIILYAWK